MTWRLVGMLLMTQVLHTILSLLLFKDARKCFIYYLFADLNYNPPYNETQANCIPTSMTFINRGYPHLLNPVPVAHPKGGRCGPRPNNISDCKVVNTLKPFCPPLILLLPIAPPPSTLRPHPAPHTILPLPRLHQLTLDGQRHVWRHASAPSTSPAGLPRPSLFLQGICPEKSQTLTDTWQRVQWPLYTARSERALQNMSPRGSWTGFSLLMYARACQIPLTRKLSLNV